MKRFLSGLALALVATSPVLAQTYRDSAGTIVQGVHVVNVNGNGQTTMSGSSPVTIASDQKVGDPCMFQAKFTADFVNTVSGGSIITAGGSGKKAYICGIRIHTSAAANISLIEGTGSGVCTGGTPGGIYLNNSTTASYGAAYGANGGDSVGFGEGTVAQNATANQNICVLFTTVNSPQVNVHVTYVQQ